MQIPELPSKPEALTQMEVRRRKIRDERRRLEAALLEVEVEMGRQSLREADAENDALVEKLVSGEIESIDRAKLPDKAVELRGRLNLTIKADQELSRQIAQGREKHNNAMAKALRPLHRQAVARIRRALIELEAANKEEQAVRDIVPGLPIRPADFPNIGAKRVTDSPVATWLRYAESMHPGLADDPDPDPEPKAAPKASALSRLVPRRTRANGAAGDAVLMAAKVADAR